jgi:hypothetical protein
LLAFFTPVGALIMAAVIANAALVSKGLKLATIGDTGPRLHRLYWMTAIVCLTGTAYFMLQIKININQSRYYIPLGIAAAFLFSIAVDVLSISFQSPAIARRARALQIWSRVSLTGAVPLVLILSGLNGYAAVAAFAVSGKLAAGNYIDERLRSEPDFSVVRISIADRSPILLSGSVCRGRCSTVILGVGTGVEVVSGGARDYETNKNDWDSYFSQIFSRLHALDGKAIILEDTVLYWTHFIPGNQPGDYAVRLNYPNPGPDAWERRCRCADSMPPDTAMAYSSSIIFGEPASS